MGGREIGAPADRGYTLGVARDPHDLDRLAAELASLTPEERARVLAAALRRMRHESRRGSDADGYGAVPPGVDEFSTEDDPLAWDAEGWDEFDAPR